MNHNYLKRSFKIAFDGSATALQRTKDMYARMTERETHWFSVAGKGMALYYLWYYGPFVVEHEWVLFILLSALIAPKAFEKIVEVAMGSKAAIAGAVSNGVQGFLRRTSDAAVSQVVSQVGREEPK